MSHLPKYPFRVVVFRRNGEKQWQESHNYENLIGAIHYRDIVFRKGNVTRIEILMVLDESFRSSNNE